MTLRVGLFQAAPLEEPGGGQEEPQNEYEAPKSGRRNLELRPKIDVAYLLIPIRTQKKIHGFAMDFPVSAEMEGRETGHRTNRQASKRLHRNLYII